MIKSFRDMDVWQKVRELSLVIFDITKDLPRSEDYALTSQIRRSSNSVSSNIAEAFGRRTKKDKNYFYTVSRSSAHETQNHFEEYDDLIHQLNKIMKSLN